ncbi:P-loop containing nucleoside triphosphate hydrolase protein [Rhexocercosporidium sp. MPI-PUGE-AT-0058]|nr:P-loop containing nucleoside triphosphate hydrolase protein [Rhexocercosporidium sp. MPI-PUGE-AT-0058]
MAECTPPPSQDDLEGSLASSALLKRQSTPSDPSGSRLSSSHSDDGELRKLPRSVWEAETCDSVPAQPTSDNDTPIQEDTQEDLPLHSSPKIKEEITTPPRTSRQDSTLSSTYKSATPNIDLAIDVKVIIDLVSDGDDDFPDIDEILARPRIKRESQTPKSPPQDFEMLDYIPMKMEDDDVSPEYTVGDAPDAPAEDSVEDSDNTAHGDGPSQDNKKKNLNQRKAQGKRARTAREWHKRRQAKLIPASRKGIAYKRKQIVEIRSNMMQDNTRRRKIKLSKRRNEARVDPRIFLDLGSRVHRSVSPHDDESDQVGQPVVDAKTKKDWWVKFLEQNHEVDLHQCKGDFNDLVKKTKSFGYNRMKPAANGKWELVVERECSDEGPWGSICADDMGMGKTVQTIATIIANPPTPEQIAKNIKTTLIIVPSSLRNQWLREIKLHAPSLGENVMQFKSALEDNTVTRLKSNDIVLTTYWELCQSYPNPGRNVVAEWEEAKLDLFQEYQRWVKNHQQENGLLHQIEWYRVVLDEGHFIKNYLSRTSRAAVALKGQHRLLLSGTPIMNSYDEFHPIFRFLREPLTMNLSPTNFQLQYGISTDETCEQCLSVVLSGLIIRRTMKDRLFNKPIVVLPQDHRSIAELESLPSEQILNRAISIRMAELKDMTFPEKDERKRLKSQYAQNTRLRQLTANPDIIAQQIVLLEASELKNLQQKVKDMRLPGRPKAFANMLYHRFGLWIKDKKNKTYEVASQDPTAEEVCLRCKETSEDMFFLKNCKHKFCETCLEEGMMRDLEDDDEVFLCPTCTKPFRESHIKPYSIPKAATKASKSDAKRSPRKGKDVRDFRPTPAQHQFCFTKWLERFDAREIDILPSAKLIGVRDKVLEWTQEAPEDKTIIFTQFRHFQVMIGCMLEKEKIKFLYFSGDMTAKQREKAITQFRDDPTIKVMIAGLKCGGLGLNLSFANRVIITDIWWNVCIDNQAFGRVFRMGQDKESHYIKMVIKNTIDSDTILELQKKKEKAINRAMQDDVNEEDYEAIFNEDYNQTVDEMIEKFGTESNNGDSDAEMADGTDEE